MCLSCNNSSSNVPGSSHHGTEHSSANTFEHSSSTFTANLEMSSGVFAIVESNKFKQLTHICLQLRPGNDSAVKGYLSSRLAFITTVANKKKQELESTLLSLTAEKQEKSQLTADLHELRALRDTDVQIVRSRHMEEITKLRLDQLTSLENERAKCDTQVRCVSHTDIY